MLKLIFLNFLAEMWKRKFGFNSRFYQKCIYFEFKITPEENKQDCPAARHNNTTFLAPKWPSLSLVILRGRKNLGPLVRFVPTLALSHSVQSKFEY